MVAFDNGWWLLAAGGGWHLVMLLVSCDIKWFLVGWRLFGGICGGGITRVVVVWWFLVGWWFVGGI